jgi:ketosteroid isomerase-like protein
MPKKKSLTLITLLVAFASAQTAIAGGWKTYDDGMAKSWEAIYNTGDDDAVAAFYTEDGIRMPPNHAAVEGRQAIAAYIRESREMIVAKVRLETDEVATSGDMGFARGTYVIIDSEGNEVDNGKWIQVGKRIDGEWYAYRDIWNSDNPLPE